MVEVRNLSFSYGRRQILKDVSFSVSSGEVSSIVRSNGAGKTTLSRVMATLAIPESGSVFLDGHNAFARPLRYRRQLGYLPESFALYEDMSVRGFLSFRARLKGEPPKRVRRRVSEAAQMCNIADFLSSPIERLSAGVRKRVALADALLLRPRLLLLDDFLSGLDFNTRESIGEILTSAAQFSSVVVTGHEIDDFAKWSTRFLVLADGGIASTISTQRLSHGETVGAVRKVLSKGGLK
jgi:ABC-2 type transport system ATP-binding protein